MVECTLADLLERGRDHDCPDANCVAMSAIADLPTRFGHFQIAAFGDRQGAEHAALIQGEPWQRDDVQCASTRSA